MRLTTRGRYGTRIMLELAMHNGKEPVLLNDIACRQNISKKYVEQILLRLKACGLVSSIRGAKGGYILKRSASEIKLLEIVKALEGPLDLVKCVGDDRTCARSSTCIARTVWKDLSHLLSRHLDSITLKSLVVKNRSLKRKVLNE